MVTDPIADYLTRIRNASRVGKKVVIIPSSKIKLELSKLLMDQGYILNYKYEDDGKQGLIYIALKYDKITKNSVIKMLKRVSRPGLRKYVEVDSIPRVYNGLGLAILSTSKGIITNKKAKELNVGGEVLCYIF